MKHYEASEAAYKNGYELGKKVMQEEFAEQFIKGFNTATGKLSFWRMTRIKTEEGEKNETH